MQYTDYVAGWAVVIQSLGSCLGLGGGIQSLDPVPAARVGGLAVVIQSLDPASLRRACVLGGRIQSLDPVAAAPVWGVRGSGYPEPGSCLGLGGGIQSLDPVPAAHVGAWQWLSRALDPASRCVLGGLGGRIQSLGSRRSCALGELGSGYPEPGSCLAGPYLEALTASCQVGGKGLGSGYPEPWILPGPWARNAAKLL